MPVPDSARNESLFGDHFFRQVSGKMVATLCKKYGITHLDVIQDLVQDTLLTALQHWRFGQIPDAPEAWLLQVAKNKAANHFLRASKTVEWNPDTNQVPDTTYELEAEVRDSQLVLLMTCCQLPLPLNTRVLLTLHVLSGFGVPELANALWLEKGTAKKQLYRAKQQLKASFPWKSTVNELAAILDTVLQVLYLLFNEGYKRTRNTEGISYDLCYEAIRLTQLIETQSGNPKLVRALLSLFFFNVARFPARITAEGTWMSLKEQDRTLYNPHCIQEGFRYLKMAVSREEQDWHPYQLEALIASLHTSSQRFEDTPWSQIAMLYSKLEILEPTQPAWTLNKVIADSYHEQTPDQLNTLLQLQERFPEDQKYQVLAALADWYLRRNNVIKAVEYYEKAMKITSSELDLQFLLAAYKKARQQLGE